MVMEMRLVGFLKTFSVKIFSQTNQKLKTIKSRFQPHFGSNENAVARNVILSKSKNAFPFENAFSMFLFLKSRKPEVKPNMFSKF